MSDQIKSDLPFSELPEGTVTFLFTDIEGSTHLWQEYPQEMPGALEQHHGLLRKSIEKHDGYVFQIIGDAFCAAFDAAGQGLEAALTAQRALQDAVWDKTGPIRVRMALHTGEAEVRAGEFSSGEYVSGLTLSHAARLLSAGHGGQILLSRSTAELLQDCLPVKVTLRDMGARHLKDMIRSEVIYQASAPDLPSEFPTLRTLDAFPTNLPFQPTPFVGRLQELAALEALFTDFHNRLVSIVGAGGMGKTRLAIAAAERQLLATTSSNGKVVTRFPDGVFFVPLAGLDSAENIISAIGEAIGFQFSPGVEPKRQLLNFFRHKQNLLVMDNFEHLLDGCAILVEILEAAPGVRALVTSRQKLNLRSEIVYPLQGMRFPDESALETGIPSQAREQYSAVVLFLQSAKRVCPEFTLNVDEMKSVARICNLVEGMPLGIELAAAWVEVLSPQEIATEIQGSLDFLATDQQDAPERHQSIRAVFNHTWRLMSDKERHVFKKLSVFRGGFTQEAAQKVVRTSLRELMRLVNKSLIQRDQNGRYGIHELLRQYAAQKLDQKDEKQVRDDHCDFYTEFLSQREIAIQGGHQAETLPEIDNIRLAWRWAYNHNKYSAIRKSYYSLFWLFQLPGWFKEALSSFGRAEGTLHQDHMAGERGIAYGAVLSLLGWFTNLTGDHERGLERIIQSQALLRKLNAKKELAIANMVVYLHGDERISLDERVKLLEESLTISEEIEIPHLRSDILLWLGWAARDQGEFDKAEHFYHEALQLSKSLNSHRTIAETLRSLGELSFLGGDCTEAREFYEESLSLLRSAGYKIAISNTLSRLAYISVAEENFPGARDILLEALAIRDDLDMPEGKAFVLHELGLVAIEMGEYKKADDYFTEALNIYITTKDRWGIGIVTCDKGDLALAQGKDLNAWKLYYDSLLIWREYRENSSYDDVCLCAIGRIAGLIKIIGDFEFSVELTTLVVDHPLSLRNERIGLLKHLDELQAKMPKKIFAEAQTRGRERDLISTGEEMLVYLEKEKENLRQANTPLNMYENNP